MASYKLILLIIIPLIGAFLTALAKYDRNYARSNVCYISRWTLASNVALILYIFSNMDIEKNSIQIVEKYEWMTFPKIDVLLGTDLFSMLLVLGINLSFLIASLCINKKEEKIKPLLATQLLFIGLINGYILAADIVSFYIFFAAISVPLIIIISILGRSDKRNSLIRFSLYNLIGIIFLLISIIMIYCYKESNIPLNTAGNLNIKGPLEYFIWGSLFLAFISRIPIWPFHYWIASVNSNLRSPLVFSVGNLMPLVGLYGFMRFWPNTVPQTIAVYAPYFEAICVITMIFIAVISLTSKEIRYKLFAYTTVYYLLYLIGIFLPTSGLKMNIGYSLFTYIIIITALSFLIGHIEFEKRRLKIYSSSSILCYMPRTSLCLSLFVLSGIGLPVTSLFWNNFIIISEIFNYNLVLGILTMLSIFIVGVALLEELYNMKDKCNNMSSQTDIRDLSRFNFFIYIGCIVILFIAFLKPLWFVM